MNILTLIIVVTIILSIMAFKNRALFYRLSLNPYSIIKKNEWYRLVTHAFIHGDYGHLFINMFVLWSFGRVVYSMLAAISNTNPVMAFLALYIGGSIVSSISDLIKKKDDYLYNSIGASGGVASVLFAFILYDPWGMIYFFGILPVPSIIFGVLYIGYEYYLGRKGGDKINHKAHIYGAIYGILFMIIYEPKMFNHFVNALITFK